MGRSWEVRGVLADPSREVWGCRVEKGAPSALGLPALCLRVWGRGHWGGGGLQWQCRGSGMGWVGGLQQEVGVLAPHLQKPEHRPSTASPCHRLCLSRTPVTPPGGGDPPHPPMEVRAAVGGGALRGAGGEGPDPTPTPPLPHRRTQSWWSWRRHPKPG